MVPGTSVLGQISEITSRDIVLTLPNNLTGFVSLTAISDQFLKQVEQFASAVEEDGADAGNEDDLDLEKYFRLGQFLRATVLPGAENAVGTAKSKKKIELSINPQDTNKGIAKSDLVVNAMVQASVASNEEHGLVMDLGLEDKKIRGFMSSKELGSSVKHEDVREGAVFLCMITGTSSDGKIVKLSANEKKTSDTKKHVLHEAPSIDVFLPGAPIELLVTNVLPHGLVGKIMGMLDATVDIFHSGTTLGSTKTYSVGSKVKARVICTFPDSEPRKVGASLLPHILSLTAPGGVDATADESALSKFPLSSFVDEAKVVDILPTLGLVVDIGLQGVRGFVHVSRISDERVDSLPEESGPYAIGTTHRGRVIGYNPIDGLLLLSFEESVLNQSFLRIHDIKNGMAVTGTVEKFHFTGQGTAGLRVRLAEGIIGFVPEIHLSDVQLQHPERKYREGMAVNARVLSADPDRRRVSLTLKKSLVNSDVEIWQDYDYISVGAQAPGTITKLTSAGAEVHFFGKVKGWLHKSEMSEAYIADPTKHFKLGQTVTVRVLSVDAEKGSLKLSCKDPEAVSAETRAAFRKLSVGDLVKGTILEKTVDALSMEVEGGIKATLKLGHFTDNSEKKELAELKRLRVGQVLDNLLVLKKLEDKVAAIISHKPSLIEAAKSGQLLKSFKDVKKGQSVVGFVRRINLEQVFIEFAGGLSGALFKSQMSDGMLKIPDFGLRLHQSVTSTIVHVDFSQERFRLSMKTQSKEEKETKETKQSGNSTAIENPIDGKTQTIDEYTFGKSTKARITSVKDTQLNVQLGDNVQGRVDISEVFGSWADIPNKKQPLQKFKAKQIISVRVIGMHDARNHRFLPISHRQGKVPVFELSAKPAETSTDGLLSLDQLAIDSVWTAFVNNHGNGSIWVNITPSVRGRVRHMDLSDDLAILLDVAKHYPIGSALRVKVKNVDSSAGHLDLVPAEKRSSLKEVTWESLSIDSILPGRIINTTERSAYVSLSPMVAGSIPLTEISDDFDDARASRFSKNEIVRVKVVSVDLPNKKVILSTRPSNVLDSSIKPKDRQIMSAANVKVNDVQRGFIKNVSDKGVFINLGPNVTAFVRISDLSDSYIKDWKASIQVDQLVTGKVIAVDVASGNVQMSLKQSMIDKDFVSPLSLDNLEVGQIVTGKIRKVEDFGVFILVDNSNISGLCHRSEMAEQRVEDVKALYSEGDKVKAMVLKVDKAKRRVNLGLKATYFQQDTEVESDEDREGDDDDDEDDDVSGDILEWTEEVLEDGVETDSDIDGMGGVELDDDRSVQSGEFNEEAEAMDVDGDEDDESPLSGLKTSGFDWTGAGMDVDEARESSGSETDDVESKKKRRRKPQIQIDRTGELDVHGPRSVADFERLLLGQPHSSLLWISYMAFQLQLNEVDKAREIARRALRTIDTREEDEKLQVRIALLNLENSFGSEETLEQEFKDGCQYHDERSIHDKLIGIYIQSGKTEVSAGGLPIINTHANIYGSTESRCFVHDHAYQQVFPRRPRTLAFVC